MWTEQIYARVWRSIPERQCGAQPLHRSLWAGCWLGTKHLVEESEFQRAPRPRGWMEPPHRGLLGPQTAKWKAASTLCVNVCRWHVHTAICTLGYEWDLTHKPFILLTVLRHWDLGMSAAAFSLTLLTKVCSDLGQRWGTGGPTEGMQLPVSCATCVCIVWHSVLFLTESCFGSLGLSHAWC